MRRFLLFSALGSCILVFTAPAASAGEAAPPKVVSFTAEPTRFEPDKRTVVTFTVVLEAEPLTKFTPRLESLKTNGTWEDVKDEVKLATVPKSSGRAFKFSLRFEEPDTRRIRLRLALSSAGAPPTVSPIVSLSVGKIVRPSEKDFPVEGPPDPTDPTVPRMKVTVPGGALRSPAYVGIAPTFKGLIGDPNVGLARAATFDLIFDPISSRDIVALTARLSISVPAPDADLGAHFYFVQEVQADTASETSGGLTAQLLTLDEGKAVEQVVESAGVKRKEKVIVTDPTQPVLPGFFSGGVIAVLKVPGSGYVTGRVEDASGFSRYGVWVRNRVDDPNAQGFFTDVNGGFVVPVNKTDYQIEALDGFRCARGDSGRLRRLPSGQTREIGTIVVNAAAPPTRDGVRNGGFEVGAPTFCWTNLTQANLVKYGWQTFEDLAGTPIEPAEDTWMAALTPSAPRIEQTFLMPALYSGGPLALFLDYQFGCRSTGPCPTTQPSTIGLQVELLNASTGATLVAQSFTGQQGWQTARVSVGSVAPGTLVRLRLTATNTNPDDRTQAAVLVDHIRFGTVTATATLLVGTATTVLQVEQQIRDANEILSQVGVNVRFRQIDQGVRQEHATCNRPPNDSSPPPFDFFGPDSGSNIQGTDVTWSTAQYPETDGTTRTAGVRRGETRALTCFGPDNHPGDPVSDVSLYYVNYLGDVIFGMTYGMAVTGEDFHGEIPPTRLMYHASDPLDVFNDTAILLPTLAGGSASDPNRPKETPAHEFGHLLTPYSMAGSVIEHASPAGNIMTSGVCIPRYNTTKCSARPILNKQQGGYFHLP